MKIKIIACVISLFVSSSIYANENKTNVLSDTPIKSEVTTKQKITLPNECTLKSFVTYGSHLLFLCEDQQVAVALFLPNDTSDSPVTPDTIVQNLVNNAGCSNTGETILGKSLLCKDGDDSYATYIKTTNSNFIESLTTNIKYNDLNKLKILQDFGVLTYFHLRKIGSNYDEINYVQSILDKANPNKDTQTLFNN